MMIGWNEYSFDHLGRLNLHIVWFIFNRCCTNRNNISNMHAIFFFHEGSNNNWLKYWMDPSLAGLKLNAFNWDRWTSIYWWLSFLGQPNIGSNLTYQTIKNAIICSFHIHSLKRTKTLPMQTNLILTSRLIIHTLMNVKKSNRWCHKNWIFHKSAHMCAVCHCILTPNEKKYKMIIIREWANVLLNIWFDLALKNVHTFQVQKLNWTQMSNSIQFNWVSLLSF